MKENVSVLRENLDTNKCQPNRDYVYFLGSSRLDGGDFASIDNDLKIIHNNHCNTEEHNYDSL